MVQKDIRGRAFSAAEPVEGEVLHLFPVVAAPSSDLLVLDIMMLGEDGLTLCRDLRANMEVPILFMTAMTDETDRIVGLELSTDGYLVKHFNPCEQLARTKAILRRVQSLPPKRDVIKVNFVHFGQWRSIPAGANSPALKMSACRFLPRSSGC